METAHCTEVLRLDGLSARDTSTSVAPFRQVPAFTVAFQQGIAPPFRAQLGISASIFLPEASVVTSVTTQSGCTPGVFRSLSTSLPSTHWGPMALPMASAIWVSAGSNVLSQMDTNVPLKASTHILMRTAGSAYVPSGWLHECLMVGCCSITPAAVVPGCRMTS